MNPDEPAPDPSLPDAPTHLSPEAREEWDRVAGELYDLGVLSAVDRAALAAYCQAYGRWVAAERELRREDGSTRARGLMMDDNETERGQVAWPRTIGTNRCT